MSLYPEDPLLNGAELMKVLSVPGQFGACASTPCVEDVHHCQTYIGPRFGNRERLLFVGLDHGKPDDPNVCLDVEKRQEQIIWRRTGQSEAGKPLKWNPHYQGCVWTASALFGMDCLDESNCKLACKSKEERGDEDCALLHFVQANVIKSVPRRKENMTFDQDEIIGKSIPSLMDEIEKIRPTVVVVHGKKIHGPLKAALRLALVDEISEHEHFWEVSWTARRAGGKPLRTCFAFFRHPARGWLSRDWTGIIKPTICEIRATLSASPDV